jgi:hypothetical protein
MLHMANLDNLAEYFESYWSALGNGPDAEEIGRFIDLGRQNRDDPMPLYRLALFAQRRGRWDFWERAVVLAAPREHVTPQAIFHRGCHRQQLGDWSAFRDKTFGRNLMEYEARRMLWVAHQHDGTTDLSDKTLLIVHTGGFGDGLQLLCFVRPLARRAAHVILGVPPELIELATYNLGDCAEIVAVEPGLLYEQIYQFDEYIIGWSMADVFEDLPTFEPLRTPRPRSKSAVDRQSLQIGICWAASNWHGLPVSGRSVGDIGLLKPLFSLEGISWHCLQVGPLPTGIGMYPHLRYPDPPLTTFADTANLIAGLDAVVSVDTAVCHLAGRLGAPTFTLLQYVADEKWGFDETTAWYPSMRLIRQPRMDDWSGAIETLASQLSTLRHLERSSVAL